MSGTLLMSQETHSAEANVVCWRVGPSYLYPDPALAPGGLNPDIAQANIHETICNPTWSTRSIRPPVSYTNALKQGFVPGEGVAAPRGPGRVGRDVAAGAEAAPLAAEHDHARRPIPVGLVETLDEHAFHVGIDGIELLGPVERDDADPAVDGVGDEWRGHETLLVAGMSAGFTCSGLIPIPTSRAGIRRSRGHRPSSRTASRGLMGLEPSSTGAMTRS